MNKSMRLTEDHVRRTRREVPDTGPLASSVVFSEDDYDAHLSAFLKERPEGPLLVFCYGSLIWKPVFQPVAWFSKWRLPANGKTFPCCGGAR